MTKNGVASRPKIWPQKPRRKFVTGARVKYYVWRFVTLVGFAILYAFLLSEGLRLIFAPTARKLHTIPFLSLLADYRETYRLDIATVLAFSLLFCIVYVWEHILDRIVFDPSGYGARSFSEIVHSDAESILFFYVGVAILICDAAIFYCSITSLSWGGASFSFTALLATVMWVGIVLILAHVTNKLRHRAFPKE